MPQLFKPTLSAEKFIATLTSQREDAAALRQLFKDNMDLLAKRKLEITVAVQDALEKAIRTSNLAVIDILCPYSDIKNARFSHMDNAVDLVIIIYATVMSQYKKRNKISQYADPSHQQQINKMHELILVRILMELGSENKASDAFGNIYLGRTRTPADQSALYELPEFTKILLTWGIPITESEMLYFSEEMQEVINDFNANARPALRA